MSVESTDNPEGRERLKRGMPDLAYLEGSLRGKRLIGRALGVHAQPSGRGAQLKLTDCKDIVLIDASPKVSASKADDH